jgi:hypothetical protein
MAETSFGRPSGYMAVGRVVNVKDDPTQTGQVRVKWLEGAASQDTIGDEDLPWTRCLFPVSNPSLGQTGGPHTGLQVGSMVYGTTVDGAGQEYMIMGSAPKSGSGEHDQDPTFDSDIPQSAKQEKTSETQPRYGDVNAIVTKKSIVPYGEQEGGGFKTAALYPGLTDSIGLQDDAITA